MPGFERYGPQAAQPCEPAELGFGAADAEERFRLSFEGAPVGMALVSGDGTWLRVNRVLCEMTGYSEEELIHLNHGITHPDDMPETVRLVRSMLSGEISFCRQEKSYIHKNGSVVRVLLNVSALPKDQNGRIRGFVAHMVDITKLKLAEQALRDSDARFRGLLESAPDAMVIVDDAGRIALVNSQTERLFGYTRDELMGASLEILVPERFRARHSDHRASYFSAPQARPMGALLELHGRHKEGHEIPVEISLSPIQIGKEMWISGSIRDSSGRRAREQALRDSETRFRGLLESAPDAMVIVDKTGQIVLINSQTERLFGYTREELLGSNVETLVPERFRARHAEERARYLSGTEERHMGGQLELHGLHKDGHEIPVEISLSPIQVANELWVSTSIRDIKSRRDRERELKRHAELLSLAREAIVIRDLEDRIVFWNRGAERQYGWSAREAMGQNIHVLLKTAWPVPVEAVDAAIRGEGSWEGELVHTRCDGQRIVVESRQMLHREDGIPNSVMEINRDITDRKHFEEKLEASRTQAVLTARLSALGEMAAGIAHEVNNPLAIVSASARNLVRMAERGEVSLPAMLEQVDRIGQTSDRIAKIVKSLRHIARDDSKDDFREVPVREIVEDCLELCRERFKVTSIRLDWPAVDCGLSIRCREAQIGQVLLNLLQNAFDAVSETDGEKWVRLEAAVQDRSIALSVVDSGGDIPPEVRSRVMEPFFTTKPAGKGTGLGLSLSRSIAEAHSGKLELSDAPGNTCFTLTLPLAGEVEPQ